MIILRNQLIFISVIKESQNNHKQTKKYFTIQLGLKCHKNGTCKVWAKLYFTVRVTGDGDGPQEPVIA